MVSDETFNRRQKIQRDAEWDAIEPFLKERSPGLFLDVGCGTGYAMARARELRFRVVGIDPEANRHGVQDESVLPVTPYIRTAAAEHIPVDDETFDVVYSSHAIEHFDDVNAGVAELAQVLKPEGRAILIIPSGTMAAIALVTMWIFYTHRSVGKFLLRTRSFQGFMQIFLGPPHGSEARYAVQEIDYFSVSRWRKTLESQFTIEHVLFPCLYPSALYPQLFPIMRLKRYASSAAFICTKRRNEQSPDLN